MNLGGSVPIAATAAAASPMAYFIGSINSSIGIGRGGMRFGSFKFSIIASATASYLSVAAGPEIGRISPPRHCSVVVP